MQSEKDWFEGEDLEQYMGTSYQKKEIRLDFNSSFKKSAVHHRWAQQTSHEEKVNGMTVFGSCYSKTEQQRKGF